MKFDEACKLIGFYPRLIIFAFILLTAIANFKLYQITKSNQTEVQHPSYSLTLEIRNRELKNDLFNFVSSCFFLTAGIYAGRRVHR